MNPLHLSKEEVYFGNHKKYFGIDDEIGNILEHLLLPKA